MIAADLPPSSRETGDRAIGMPFCMETRRPISCALASSWAASRSRASARSAGARADQPDGSSNARRAAATATATAASTSAASGTEPITSPVEALRTSILLAELGGNPRAADEQLVVNNRHLSGLSLPRIQWPPLRLPGWMW
jgi:hypothetical protein